MATQTPKKDNLHGEPDAEPRFQSEHNPAGYDPELNNSSSSKEPASYSSGNPWPQGGPKPASRDELQNQESNPANGASTAVDAAEKSLQDKAGGRINSTRPGSFSYSHEGYGRFSGLRGRLMNTSRRRIAVIAVTGLVGGGGLFAGSILSGPFQFIHFAQNLQKHFRSNEDFGNDRTSKVLLYALSGRGAQNGRLGITGNVAANKWEKRLVRDTGMRPVYQEGSRRFVGFEIVDDNKAQGVLGEIDTDNNRRLEQSMGKGADIRTAEGRALVNSTGQTLDARTRFVDLTDVNFAERRTWIKTIGNSTQTIRIASAISSRILIKRAGVDFHPFSKVKGKLDNAGEKRIVDRRNKTIAEEAKSVDALRADDSDRNGDGTSDGTLPEDVNASEETKNYIQDFKNSGALKSGASATIVIGVLCAAKTFGNGVEDYKYQNNLMPMIRLGFHSIAAGNQAMSGDDIDLGTLGVMSDYMYDKEKKTSWIQAESIRAAQGKDGGVPIAKEADLRNAGEKPALFNALDGIPLLGTTCNTVEGFFGLPIIKQVSQGISAVTQQLADAAFGLAGTSSDELFESAMKAVAGKSVDVNSKGAAFGALADAGSFSAANDQAIATGGRALEPGERDQLALLEEGYESQDRSSKSLSSRYLDPYDQASAVGSMIDRSPVNASQAASMFSNPAKVIGSAFSSVANTFTPKAKAAFTSYNYGIHKYGFSADEQASDRYENPYENGVSRVEPQLDQLNEKYGKCFGMTITTDETGVHINSADKSVNVFKVYKENPECDPKKNNDPSLTDYRFYIADAMTAVSLACYEGDDEACGEVGLTAAGSDDGAISGTGAQKIVAVAEKEFEKNGNKVLETCGINCGPEVQKYTGGPSGPDAPWCAWFVSWVYRAAGYEFKGAPAGADGNIPAVENLALWFELHGLHFLQDAPNDKPQPGDVIMYGGGVHTGIVVKVNGDNIETIEGNTSSDNNFDANGGTVGRKSFNYKTYSSRSIEFGRLKKF